MEKKKRIHEDFEGVVWKGQDNFLHGSGSIGAKTQPPACALSAAAG
jgi:hypothetical protein